MAGNNIVQYARRTAIIGAFAANKEIERIASQGISTRIFTIQPGAAGQSYLIAGGAAADRCRDGAEIKLAFGCDPAVAVTVSTTVSTGIYRICGENDQTSAYGQTQSGFEFEILEWLVTHCHSFVF